MGASVLDSESVEWAPASWTPSFQLFCFHPLERTAQVEDVIVILELILTATLAANSELIRLFFSQYIEASSAYIRNGHVVWYDVVLADRTNAETDGLLSSALHAFDAVCL